MKTPRSFLGGIDAVAGQNECTWEAEHIHVKLLEARPDLGGGCEHPGTTASGSLLTGDRYFRAIRPMRFPTQGGHQLQ